MKKEFDTLVFIGRMQPLTIAHESVIKQALEKAERLIIFLGSANSPSTDKNPFTVEYRESMIRVAFPYANIDCIPLNDYKYNDNKWKTAIQKGVDKISKPNEKIGLIGHSKDESSYYLKMFPQWGSIEVKNIDGINATDVRNVMWSENTLMKHWYNDANFKVSETTEFLIYEWARNPFNEHDHGSKEYQNIINERYFVKTFKDSWAKAPYPPTFNTADTVITCSGHILLVKRGQYPGKGLWALPGGYINQFETYLNAAIRELREETKLKVPEAVLKGNIVNSKVFDAPDRSPRGRVITKAFHIDLGDQIKLPKVKGSDDAEKAEWVPLKNIDGVKMFEDHAHIIDYFLDIM